MKYVVTAEEMQAIDAATIEEIGLPGVVLMENAGQRVADAVVEELARAGGGPVAVVCGAGNNGGDGYVIARELRERGVAAAVYLAVPRARIAGDARVHFQVYERLGGPVVAIDGAGSLEAARAAIEGAAVVVDAVFGTGLGREVEGHFRRVLEVVRGARGRIVSVDVPSGLSADTGHPLGVAVEPHVTVTIAFLKVGIAVAPGFARAGRVRVAPIGIPTSLAPARGVRLALVEEADVAGLLRAPDPLEHKTRRGHLLVVAGSPGKRGAARLTALAGLRAGAGLCTIAARGGGADLEVPDPVMSAELDPADAGARGRLCELAEGKRAVAIGPGMPTGAPGRGLVMAALEELEVPLCLDADALNHLGGDLAPVAAARAPVVLTPHPGEAARLLGTSAAEIERDRVGAARELAARSRKVVVLKGARTLSCDGAAGDGFVTINPTGGPGLATAGSGDVLTGVVGALLAQGLAAADAARLAVYAHGAAGDAAEAALGMRGVIASDLVDALPRVLRDLGGEAAARG